MKIDFLITQIEFAFGKIDTLSEVTKEKLRNLLKTAPTEALKIIIERKIKHCTLIAKDILDQRKE